MLNLIRLKVIIFGVLIFTGCSSIVIQDENIFEERIGNYVYFVKRVSITENKEHKSGIDSGDQTKEEPKTQKFILYNKSRSSFKLKDRVIEKESITEGLNLTTLEELKYKTRYRNEIKIYRHNNFKNIFFIRDNDGK